MEFIKKKLLYKKEKYNLPKIIQNNKQIFFGSGGSHNVTIIHNDIAIKIIPEFNKHPLEKIKRNNDQQEINHYVLFTKEFILPNITPHIVGYFSHYKIYDIQTIFPKKCKNMSEILLLSPKKIDKANINLCKMKKEYHNKIILPRADLLILEKCDQTIEMVVMKIINNKQKLGDFIDRTIFQFMYTMACIQKKYPKFIHNDLFLRNILGVLENQYEDNECVEYIWDNISYYLPANGFYLKINDFGYSLNPPKIISTLKKDIEFNPLGNMEYDDPKRDIFTFLYDYYDGANLGHPSTMRMIKSLATKKYIRKQFSKYINVAIIDQIHKYNRDKIAWMWNIGHIKLLQDTVLLPHKYFSKGVFNKYTKRDHCRIVKTFSLH